MKLTRELLEVMDSDSEGTPSVLFDYFKVGGMGVCVDFDSGVLRQHCVAICNRQNEASGCVF